MTLIEILVSLGILSLIIVSVVLAHTALTRSTSRQLQQLKHRERLMSVVTPMRDDLQNLFIPETDPDSGIDLVSTDGRLSELAFCAWERAAGDYPALTGRLIRVRYHIGERSGRPALLRARSTYGAAAGAGATTNWIEPGWTDVGVQLLVDGAWIADTAGDTNRLQPPQAARIRFMDPELEAPVYETMILIPAGLSADRTREEASGLSPR